MRKLILIFIVSIIIVGSGAFYGGMKYQESKNPLSGFSRQNFDNLSEEQRQQLQANAGGTLPGGASRRAGSNFLSGEVIAKDEKTLTLKTPDGGSKIVFLSASTTVSKMDDGSVNDIEIGKQIMINGQQNSDGSYTAQTIQMGQSPQ